MINIIAAASINNVIGKNKKIPWNIPEDLKFFKEKTNGANIIMGRKTFESIGKPLPKRYNIVITRQKHLSIKGAITVNSLQEAIQKCERDRDIFIIGGEEIYKKSLPITNRIYLTRVQKYIEDGDAFFPDIDNKQWNKKKIDETVSDGVKVEFLEFNRS